MAAGLRSAVLGESEVLGQVRGAWMLGQREGHRRAPLNLLFRRAVEVGKRARTETAIGRGTASVSHAVEMAEERLGSLAAAKVVVVGAGDVGEGTAVALSARGVGQLVVVNRTETRGGALAERTGGRLAPAASLLTSWRRPDVVVTCTGAAVPVLDHDLMSTVVDAQRRTPAARPRHRRARDVEASVAALSRRHPPRPRGPPGLGRPRPPGRAAEAEQVREIVAGEVDRYLDDASAREVAPLGALHDHAEHVRQAELARFQRRLADLDATERKRSRRSPGPDRQAARQPTVRLKEDAGTPRGERNAAALRDLFDLP